MSYMKCRYKPFSTTNCGHKITVIVGAYLCNNFAEKILKNPINKRAMLIEIIAKRTNVFNYFYSLINDA